MAAAHTGIGLIDTRHETVAVQAAEGYAKVKGRVGLAFMTANSGFSNGLPGLATAFADRSPIFVITSSPPLRDAETNALQGFHDQVVVSSSITKFSHRVTNVGEIPRITSLAWRTTMAGAPGPVLVDYPIDVLFTPVDQQGVSWGSVLSPLVNLPGPDPAAVDATLTAWRAAKRPAILVSTGAAGVSPDDDPSPHRLTQVRLYRKSCSWQRLWEPRYSRPRSLAPAYPTTLRSMEDSQLI